MASHSVERRVALADLHRGSPGVPKVGLGRDADGSFFVEWAPPELNGWTVRYRWWTMVAAELEDGDPRKVVQWAAGPPEVTAPDPPVPWTAREENTLHANAYAYRRYAEQLRDGRLSAAIHTRIETLDLDDLRYKRMRPDQLPDTYLVALARRVQELREAGWNVEEIGGWQEAGNLKKRTLNRRLAEAKARGLA